MLSPEIESQLGPMADPNNFSAHDLFSSLTYGDTSPGSVSPEHNAFSRPTPSSVPPTHTKSEQSSSSTQDYVSRGKENTNSQQSRSPFSAATSLPRTPDKQLDSGTDNDLARRESMQNIRRSARDRRKRNKQEEQERVSRDNTQESSFTGFAGNSLPRTPPSGSQRSPITQGESPLEAVGRALSNTSLDNSSVTRSLFSDKDTANKYKPVKKTSKLKVNTSFGGSIAGVGYADRFQKELDNRPINPSKGTLSDSSLHTMSNGLPMPFSDENPSNLALDAIQCLARRR